MAAPREVLAGVHEIPLLGAQCHLIVEDRLTLVDAGLPGSRARIEPYVAKLGRSLDELERIVLTHGHPDHVGGVNELAGTRTEVLLHPDDFENLAVSLEGLLRRPSRGRFFGFVARTPARLQPLNDGEVLPVLGGLEVVHTPGHTPGSVCLYSARLRALWVGDSLERKRDRVTFASRWYSDDVALARESVRRMAERDVDTLLFAHDPPWTDDASGVLRALATRTGMS
jgi:glyoxylase-like metal-dependent hydrolase (beta-lactamase superfamily II)